MKRLAWIGVMLAGCVSKPGVDREVAPRWVPVEKSVADLEYPAGDGSVEATSRVIVLVPSPALPRGRRPAPRLSLPGRVEVGEAFRIEIRIPRGDERATRNFRVRCGRAGLRLLEGDRAVLKGRTPAFLKAVADSPGPATFDLEEIDD